MSLFGWSLPPGCGTLPGEEPCAPYQFDNDFGVEEVESVYWDEDGRIFAQRRDGSEFTIGQYDGEDVLEAKKVASDYFDSIRRETGQLRSQIARLPKKPFRSPVPAPEVWLNELGAPEGDFDWSDSEAGDWQPYYCEDCDTYHKNAQAVSIKRKDKKISIEVYYVDEDGNWDCMASWATGDSRENWEWLFQCYLDADLRRQSIEWAEYHLWCATEGKRDPLGDLPQRNAAPHEHLKHARDYVHWMLPKRGRKA